MTEAPTLVLGNSVRSAVTAMQAHKDGDSICIISPSPRAQRRMNEEELIETFERGGKILKKMQRAEVHFYASDSVRCPAKCLTVFLRGCDQLVYLLLNGMRICGTHEDLVELGEAFREHPTLHRMCLFNAESVDPKNLPLSPILDGIKRSRKIRDVALRYLNWIGPYIGDFMNEDSQIKTLRLTGKITFCETGAVNLFTALKKNKNLRELAINRCGPPVNLGVLVAEMLEENQSLVTVVVELISFPEIVPIAKAMRSLKNKTCKKLDLTITNQEVFDPKSKRNKQEEIATAKLECEQTLEANTNMHGLVITDNRPPTPAVVTSPKMELFLRLNRAGRKYILLNDNLSSSCILRFLDSHSTDHSMIYYLLSTKPSLLEQLCASCCNHKSMIHKHEVVSSAKKRSASASAARAPPAAAAAAAASASRKRRKVVTADQSKQPAWNKFLAEIKPTIAHTIGPRNGGG